MKQGEVKRIFFGVVSEYFKAAEVAWSKQNLTVKSKEPFVRLTAGNLKRSRFPAVSVIDGVPVNAYKCSFPIVVDLFTNGAEVPGSEQTENTAVQDLSSFMDFLDSEYVTDRCFSHGITILFDPTDVQDLSAAIYDANYEYRAQITLVLSFMTRTVGYTGTYGEETVKTVEIVEKDESGIEVIVGTEETIDMTEPFEPSASGGNTEDLARNIDCGYFTDVEMNYDRSED